MARTLRSSDGIDSILSQYPAVQANVNPGGFQQAQDWSYPAGNTASSAGNTASNVAGAAAGAVESVNPLGAIIGGAGGIINSLVTWYAVGQQRKENQKARELQEKLFYEDLGFQREQADRGYQLSLEGLGLQKRQLVSAERLGKRQQRLAESTARTQAGLAKRGMTLQETESEASRALAERGMGLQERTTEADIGFRERDIALQEKTAKFNQAATLVSNMTSMFNSPQTRSQYATLWRGYGR